MINFIKKISVIFLTAFVICGFTPFAFAQSEVPSPLENIKEKLEEEPISCTSNADCGSGNLCNTEKICVDKDGKIITCEEDSDCGSGNECNTAKICVDKDGKIITIDVIDFSTNKWGKLPERIIEALKEAKYESLPEMYQKLKDLIEETQNTLTDQEIAKGVSAENKAIGIFKETLSAIEYKYVNDEGDNDTAPLSEDDIDLIVSEVLAYQYAGERQVRDIVMSITNTVRNIIGSIAIIWIIISGIRMVFAGGDETAITEQKRSIIYAVIGLVAILLIERMIDIIYGPLGTYRTALETADTTKFSMEVFGVVNFIKALFGILAIFMIIISGIKTIFAFGDEEKLKKQKTSIFWIIIGFVLVLINKVVIENIFIIPTTEYKDQIQASNINTLITTLGLVIQFALGFVGLFALGALIYGAGTMVANYGNDEMLKKSKSIIKNAIIGIIVVISAYTIVATLIVFK